MYGAVSSSLSLGGFVRTDHNRKFYEILLIIVHSVTNVEIPSKKKTTYEGYVKVARFLESAFSNLFFENIISQIRPGTDLHGHARRSDVGDRSLLFRRSDVANNSCLQ